MSGSKAAITTIFVVLAYAKAKRNYVISPNLPIYTDDGHLEWLDERPRAGRHRVIVTILDQPDHALGGLPPTPEEIQHVFDEMHRLRNQKKTPEETQRILDETRGAWGNEKTTDEIGREIDALFG